MKNKPIAYNDIISLVNLHEAWGEFLPGKKHKKDVAEFSLRLSAHIFSLHEDLKNREYRHGAYAAFAINDPKPRSIHKATVRDRLLHHAIYKILYPHFDRLFIHDSYSCRVLKGTHRALGRFRQLSRKASKNGSRTCWVLKCDIRKFFASIDHAALMRILEKHIADRDIIALLREVIGSFHSTRPGVGLPLGNLTSQLLVNIYMNEFDQRMKHAFKVPYYIRYADDFVILDHDKSRLLELLLKIGDFLSEELKLLLHPDKVFIKTLSSGVDFLGWVHFPDHRVLRTVTKRRMLKNIGPDAKKETVQSYLGMLSHGNAKKLQAKIRGLSPHR
jgi:RNA-directed DNA polymerase